MEKKSKNNLMKNLELLSILDDYVIEENGEAYTIECKSYNWNEFNQLYAYIDKKTNDIAYSMKGLYDNGSDSEEIDMVQLEKLQKVVKLLLEE